MIPTMAWVIVGLGNPGEEYKNTRHNAGRMAVEHFARKNEFPDRKTDSKNKLTLAKGSVNTSSVLVIMPDTFMNKSGLAVAKHIKTVKGAEKLVVVYDDMDLPLGTIKLSYDRGSGGHKGLESVARTIKTTKFTRIRIGVSPVTAKGVAKKPQGEDAVLKFILAKFKPAEMDVLTKVFKRTTEALDAIISQGPMMAMNEFNRG